MNKSPIKVLLVEDSPIALKVLCDLLNSSPDIVVVGTCGNGKDALIAIPKEEPDVICTDLYMDGMSGLELTQQIMATCPKPILVISVAVRPEDSHNTQALLKAGAVDMWPKPSSGLESDYEKAKATLMTKIKVLAGVKVFKRPLTASSRTSSATETRVTTQASSRLTTADVESPLKMQTAVERLTANHIRKAAANTQRNERIQIVAIGASTGGPQAVSSVISQFDSTFPIPILCTQHISAGFLQGLVDCMAVDWQMRVKVAEDGECPLPGIVYYAPEQHHLSFDPSGNFAYGEAAPDDLHCPSVNVMFESIARSYGQSALGILLTGMGRDGAAGLKAISDVGGVTIAQDEATSIVFGMPREAIELGAAQHVLPLQDIASHVIAKL
ncbi:MAG: chemotaxis-specific protein-glutamate methyltransferase CheB [Cyanobacteria bacterium P01_A01_bin.3]